MSHVPRRGMYSTWYHTLCIILFILHCHAHTQGGQYIMYELHQHHPMHGSWLYTWMSPQKTVKLGICHRHIWHTHDMAYLFTRLMDLDDSKAHLIAIRYLRADYNHSAASAVPPGTISLRLLPNMATSSLWCPIFHICPCMAIMVWKSDRSCNPNVC